ncbi:syntaxin [Acrasis kona]|uniref:Syntaxin n=1 Tax=Acrasis kona TaxID=1008807 RepID=A0AAW2Z0P1_9EUKA
MDVTLEFLGFVEKSRLNSDQIETEHSTEKSSFIESAAAIREELYDVYEEIIEYTRHYLRTSVSGATAQQPFAAISISEQLRQTNANISDLKDVLSQFEENSKQAKLNENSQQRAHYHAVIHFLAVLSKKVTQQYDVVGSMQQESVNVSQKLFNDTAVQSLSNEQLKAINDGYRQEQDDEDDVQIPAELQQQLREENLLLHEELDAALEDAMDAARKAMEIGDLVQIFEEKINEQSAMIEQLYSNSLKTSSNIVDAKEVLITTGKGSKTWFPSFSTLFRNMLLYLLLFASIMLVIFDQVNS